MPTGTPLKGKGNQASLAEQLIAGTQKHLATIAQVVVAGGTFTPAQLVAKLQAFADLRNAVDAARATLKAKLVDEKAQGPLLRAFFIAFVAFVRAAFGNAPDVLADFGLAPKKVKTPQTVEQKAAAAAKRAATRKARGIIGKRKRADVKGNVTGVDITPVTAPAAPAPQVPEPAQKAPSTPDAQPNTGATQPK